MANFPATNEDKQRIDNYRTNEDIFLGLHSTAFAKFSALMAKEQKSLIYIVCNFGALISKVSADLLFGEQIKFKWPKEVKDTKWFDELIENNKLHTRNYESALSNSYHGDSVIKVRQAENKKIIIEYITPEIVFVNLDSDNINETKSIEIAWIKQQGDTKYVRKEIHYKGKIVNELWLLNGDILSEKVDLGIFYDNMPEEQNTGVDDFLVKIIPNWKTSNRFWGISDYNDLHSLFDEANNRITRLADILNKHSNPKLAVPRGVIDKKGQVRTQNFDLFEVVATTGGVAKPEYITWDASLEAAFKEIDKIVEFVFLFSETSPSVFGMDKGGTAESGRALKFRLLRTLAKISRKKNYYDEALKWAMVVAQKLAKKTPVIPKIEWQDGIPQDTFEQAQIEEIRLRSGNTSRESSIRRLDSGSNDDIKEEMEKIGSETKEVTSSIGNKPPMLDMSKLMGGGKEPKEPMMKKE